MSKKKARWRKLDNAAKLYSAASIKKEYESVSFFTCELKEEVNPDVLSGSIESDNRNISYVFNWCFAKDYSGIILSHVIYDRL